MRRPNLILAEVATALEVPADGLPFLSLLGAVIAKATLVGFPFTGSDRPLQQAHVDPVPRTKLRWTSTDVAGSRNRFQQNPGTTRQWAHDEPKQRRKPPNNQKNRVRRFIWTKKKRSEPTRGGGLTCKKKGGSFTAGG